MQNKSRFFASLWSRAYVLLTFTALFWAGNAIVARAACELVPPVALAFWRWTIALAIILPFADTAPVADRRVEKVAGHAGQRACLAKKMPGPCGRVMDGGRAGIRRRQGWREPEAVGFGLFCF